MAETTLPNHRGETAVTSPQRKRVGPRGSTFTVTPTGLAYAWSRYVHLFDEPPHGTETQMAALLELAPPTHVAPAERQKKGEARS